MMTTAKELLELIEKKSGDFVIEIRVKDTPELEKTYVSGAKGNQILDTNSIKHAQIFYSDESAEKWIKKHVLPAVAKDLDFKIVSLKK